MNFYTSDGSTKKGPFSLEEIKNNSISKSTLVWKQGSSDWIEAQNIPELKMLFLDVPPPLPSEKTKESSSYILTRFITATIFAVLTKFISYDLIVNNFGGQNQMGNHDYSEAQSVSYFLAVIAFILVALIMRFIKNK